MNSHPFNWRPISSIALVLWLLIVSLCSHANERGLIDSSNKGFSSSVSDNAINIGNQPSFLPVAEAYRLSAELSNDTLLLHWDIAPNYYLYQHQAKVIVEDQSQSLAFEKPQGLIKYDDYFERELEVYYQQLDLTVKLPARSNQQPYRLQIHSQGCADAGLCYPPQTQLLEVDGDTVTLIEGPSRASRSDASNLTNTSRLSASIEPKIFLWSLLGAILGGILLNLMPCVFPVLSIKALSLMQQKNHSKQHLHGWAYTLGAIATFTGIAALMFSLRSAGQAVGWGFQLQSPVVIASLAYLFFTMGLLLFGQFNFSFSLATNLNNRGQHLTEGGGLKGSFFTGALASIVASPCTAPFMAGALGYAVTLPTIAGLIVFAFLGFGMALPFLLLSYSPKLQQRLPKPGQWMETLKQLLAFPLFATALWLLWVLGRQSGSDTVIAFAAGALLITMALWLYEGSTSILKQTLAAVLFASALLPYQFIDKNNASPQSLSNDWQPYSQARFEQLKNSDSPVFINLSADWCITCLSNEKIALDTEASLSAFEQARVVKLKGDWTNYNPEITTLLSKYQRSGVPLYLLFPAGTASEARILPQILTQQRVLDALSNL